MFIEQGKTNWRYVVIVLLLAVILGGGVLAYQRWWLPQEGAKSPRKPVACTQEAKLCPDGSAVGRVGPNCEFTSCPNAEEDKLKEEIGQMLILGFRGTQYQEDSFIDKSINNLKIGGVILFDFDVPSAAFPRNIINPRQTKQLITELQKKSKIPLFITIDVEGGLVNRLKPKYGFMEVPSAEDLGKGTPQETFQTAKALGKELKGLGINFDFVPVVDLNINPQNPVIGKLGRAFSADPQTVISHAASFINGLKENHIISSIKHFPGHGSSTADSHQGMVDITNTYQAEELMPFQELIKKNIAPTVMVAHTINKNLDQQYPATLSKNTIQKTLKELLKFQGVVVCDDLSMGAISKNYGLEEAAVKMVEAGCDLIIISNNVTSYDEALPLKVVEAIFQAVQTSEISTSSIEASYQKILKLKSDFAIAPATL